MWSTAGDLLLSEEAMTVGGGGGCVIFDVSGGCVVCVGGGCGGCLRVSWMLWRVNWSRLWGRVGGGRGYQKSAAGSSDGRGSWGAVMRRHWGVARGDVTPDLPPTREPSLTPLQAGADTTCLITKYCAFGTRGAMGCITPVSPSPWGAGNTSTLPTEPLDVRYLAGGSSQGGPRSPQYPLQPEDPGPPTLGDDQPHHICPCTHCASPEATRVEAGGGGGGGGAGETPQKSVSRVTSLDLTQRNPHHPADPPEHERVLGLTLEGRVYGVCEPSSPLPHTFLTFLTILTPSSPLLHTFLTFLTILTPSSLLPHTFLTFLTILTLPHSFLTPLK
ncbi:putative cyclic nucleotide gated non-selective ion channel alpha 2 [Homarus americanus]|uniref:Putative cyclic nucleotide gated non-selective ion channel alpha 2 n=1 Tax=Homarus americanus TaxID=6706 RepID=A0A8J5MML0_HOMAM|nr:putative cyclic nucleotide gated non-selective ion channel alpha 2 [Homarus americanus]